MEYTWLAASGVLIGILIFALKISLGCGLASLSRREGLLVASLYLVIFLFMGAIIELIPDGTISSILNLGVIMHVIIALLLVALGVLTAREWNQKSNDISRKTFWALSLPCPACLAATFLSCSMIATLLDLPPWKVGLGMGIIFLTAIVALSNSLGRIKKAPSRLGDVMIFIGLFYLLSILVIPAYLRSQSIPFVPMTIPSSDLIVSYLFISSLVALGFISRRASL